MRTKETSRRVLGRGDVVSIVGETQDREWGSGLARAWAEVHGHSGDGWYAGVLEDGSPVEFHEDQVEGLLEERAGLGGLGGIRDWFGKKAPAPGPIGLPAQPQDPGGSIIYVGPTGVARYEEVPAVPQPKGFLNTIKESVASMVDAFKGSGNMAPRAETPMTRYEKKPSMFAAFAPDAPKPMQAFQKRVTSFIAPKGPGPLAPFVESAKELFKSVKPSQEPETYEARATRQHEIWSGMFQEDEEGRGLFEVFMPSEVIMPEDAQLPPEMLQEIKQGKIVALVIPLPPRTTLLPTPEDVARGLMMMYDPIDEKIFNVVRTGREREEFRKAAAMCLDVGDPAGIIIDSVAGSGYMAGLSQDENMALAALLQIPWDYVESKTKREWVTYGDGPRRKRHLEIVNEEDLSEEIFQPAMTIVTQAFELIKPDDLPGTFEIIEHSDHAHLALMYTECDPQPGRSTWVAPGVAFEEEEAEEEAEEAEEVFGGEDYEWTPERMVGRLNELADKRGKLDPEAEDYEELLDEIEVEAKEIKDYLVQIEKPKEVKKKKAKKAKKGEKK